MLGEWETVTVSADGTIKQEVIDDQVNIKVEQEEEEVEPKKEKEEDNQEWNWVLEEEQDTPSSSNKGEDDDLKTYHCDVCDFDTTDLLCLMVHWSQAHDWKDYQCQYKDCYKEFNSIARLYHHYNEHKESSKNTPKTKAAVEQNKANRTNETTSHSRKPRQNSTLPLDKMHCNVCSSSHPEQPCVCLRCHAHLECRKEYQLHQKGCTWIALKCCVCLEPFKELPVLLAHLKSGKHKRPELEMARIWDRYPFFDNSEINQKCDICDERFQNLEVHIKKNHKEVLKQKRLDLVRTATVERVDEQECVAKKKRKDACDAEGSSLKPVEIKPAPPAISIVTHAVDIDPKTFNCSLCGRYFITSFQRNHRLTMVSKSEFPCSTCPYVGKSAVEVERHKVDCPFKCYQCEETVPLRK